LPQKSAKNGVYTSDMSHRSGETEDNTIADLARLLNFKIDRLSKHHDLIVWQYNQLQMEEELGNTAYFPGKKAFKCKIIVSFDNTRAVHFIWRAFV
jgi:enolase